MSYSETFSSQFDTLISNFTAEIGKLSPESITIGKVSEWYRVNSFCWNSIVEPEGMQLDQQNNPELTRKLTAALRDFRFEKVENDMKRPSILPYAVAGVAASVLLCVILRAALHIAVWKLILLGLIIITLPFIILAPRIDKYNTEAPRRLCESYAGQLREYRQVLVGVCEEFEKEAEEPEDMDSEPNE